MGKYMRQQKEKSAGDVASVDIAQSSLGVRTRAKTLALQRLPKAELAYLQLRSRRLEKPPIAVKSYQSKRLSQGVRGVRCELETSISQANCLMKEKKGKIEERSDGYDVIQGAAAGVEEAPFGEHMLEIEGGERSTKENTPCSLIRDPESIRTPCSSTRLTSSIEAQAHNSVLRRIPTAHAMDKFFEGTEEQQQEQFIRKYNFDPVKEVPLPGRYEWVKLKPKQ